MTTHVALLLFGAVLLLIAIVGGGFEIQNLKIPKVQILPRILAAIGGILFMLLGMTFRDGPDTRNGNEILLSLAPDVQLRRQTSPRKIQFVIFDELQAQHIAAGQSEQALIRINGSSVGTLTVNEHFPSSELIVTVPNEGHHSFVIEATAVFRINNKLTEVSCYGIGTIDVEPGSRFLFEARYDERGPCLAWLERR